MYHYNNDASAKVEHKMLLLKDYSFFFIKKK